MSQACRFNTISLVEGLTPEFTYAAIADQMTNQRKLFKVPMERISKFAPKGDTKEVEDFFAEGLWALPQIPHLSARCEIRDDTKNKI